MSSVAPHHRETSATPLPGLGIAPFNIASSVILIITSQRLARRLCANCKAPIDIPVKTLLNAGYAEAELEEPWTSDRPVGRASCNNVYKGRFGIYQVMPIRKKIQRIILRDGSTMDMREQAKREGVRSLRQVGLHKLKLGLTSLEEVLAVTNQ